MRSATYASSEREENGQLGPPIFIIGTGRSGTTLLRLMLCAHPRIYIAHEASFYLFHALYGKRAAPREFLEYYFQTPWFRWLRLDPARVLAGLPDPLPPDRLGEAFEAIMRQKAAQYGRARYGDKTPSHSDHLRHLFADFPDARVIRMVRDPRGVALSLSRMPWASAGLWSNAHFCATERRQVAPFRDRILHVRLEDLLGEPRETMQRILDHIGEPWDDAVLDHARHLADAEDMPPFPWLAGAARPLGTPSARWQALPPVRLRAMERAARAVMTDMGYAPATLQREPSRLAVWWAAMREIPGWLRYLGAYVRLVLYLRDPRHFEDEHYRALWRRINPGSWALYPGFVIPSSPPLISPAASGPTADARAEGGTT